MVQEIILQKKRKKRSRYYTVKVIIDRRNRFIAKQKNLAFSCVFDSK